MKIPSPSSRAASRGVILKILAVAAALVVAGVAALGVMVWRMFAVDADLREVRKTVFAATQVATTGKVEVGVPRLVPALARLVVPFVDLPEEARQAIRAVRGADVGVYQLRDAVSGEQRRELVDQVTRVLEARDWSRTVAVCDRDETVMVFTPVKLESEEQFAALVLVIDRDQMVLVHGRANLAPVFELADARWREHGRPRLALH